MYRIGLAILMLVAGVARGESNSLSAHVDFSVSRGVKYLYSLQQPDGSFICPGPYIDMGGPTALCTLALVSAGEPLTKPEIRKAYEWLGKKTITDTYSLSLRAAAFSQLGDLEKNSLLRKDAQRLISMQIGSGPHRGFYTYEMPRGEITFGDLSNSQYGVLGVWYAAEAGVEVPRGYWERVENGWTIAQGKDGGFAYRPEMRGGGEAGGSYGSMTAAGIATLAITHDFLHAAEAGGPKGRAAALRSKSAMGEMRAIDWLGHYFLVDRNPGRDTELAPIGGAVAGGAGGVGGGGGRGLPRAFAGLGNFADGSYIHYMLFGYERVGEATGLTRFGDKRWFEQGARFLIATQSSDGSWANGSFGETIDTAYALLFLSRGRSPVVIQKLQWTPEKAGGDRSVRAKADVPEWGGWNNRTRDAASIVRWLRRQTERHVNWQVTRLDYPAEEIREAPILYAASDQAFDLPEKDWSAFKHYIDEGGLFLAADESNNKVFAKSVEKLLEKLYPSLVFRDLPKDHPFVTANFKGVGVDVPVRVLSNGVRELALVLPTGDFPWRWQRTLGTIGGKSPDFALVGNALVSVTGRASLRNKGAQHYEERDGGVGEAAKKWSVGRIIYAGNWNPEPLAYEAFANHLHNAGIAELSTMALSLTDSLLTVKQFPVIHMTATHPVSLSDREKRSLGAYLKAGGFLIYDTAGGVDVESELTVEQMLTEAAGGVGGVKLRDLPADHAVYAGVVNGEGKMMYRPASVERTGGRLAAGRLRGVYIGEKLVGILSAEDLMGGLLNLPHDEIVGPGAEGARGIVGNVLGMVEGEGRNPKH